MFSTNALQVDRDVFTKTKGLQISRSLRINLFLAPNNLKSYSSPPLSDLTVGKYRRLTCPILVSPSCTAWASRAQSAPQLMDKHRTLTKGPSLSTTITPNHCQEFSKADGTLDPVPKCADL